jgi:lipopolysaccharide transport system permease protein
MADSQPPQTDQPPKAKLVLDAQQASGLLDFRELWRYRELAGFLGMRDIKVRYKQTALGAAWAILQPVMNMIVFTVFFNKLAGVGSDENIPYPVSVFCALLPWQLFESSVTLAGNSVVNSERLISKVYFPRVLVPISSIASALVDFAIAFVILILLMIWYGVHPHLAPLLLLPLFIAVAVMVSLALGLWLSALNVTYRDVRYAIPFLLRLWFFATPIVYPISSIPPAWRAWYGLNPMVGVVEGFRWALLGKSSPSLPAIGISIVVAIVLLIGGLFYFHRTEQVFADVI